jgi:hypothetical protein
MNIILLIHALVSYTIYMHISAEMAKGCTIAWYVVGRREGYSEGRVKEVLGGRKEGW